MAFCDTFRHVSNGQTLGTEFFFCWTNVIIWSNSNNSRTAIKRDRRGLGMQRAHKRMSIIIPYTCNLQICSKRVRIGAIQPSEILEEKPCMPCMLFFVNTCFQQKQYCFYANSALPLSGTNMCNEHLTYSYNPSPSCFFTSDQLFPLFITGPCPVTPVLSAVVRLLILVGCACMHPSTVFFL